MPSSNALSSLSVKITGIVFWGLVIVGLLVSFVILERYEYELEQVYAQSEAQFSEEIQATLNQEPGLDPERLKQRLLGLTKLLKIPAAKLSFEQHEVVVGAIDPRLVPHFQTLHIIGADGKLSNVMVAVYQVDIEPVVDQYRKTFLMSMGALLFLFGYLLKWVLERVLTQPFLQMVDTAQQFSADQQVRFNEKRSDEFGDLARFINQSLDHLLTQQGELKASLQRQHLSEQALLEEKERIKVTLQSIAEGVITTDQSMCVSYLNPIAERLLGIGLSECKGRLITDVVQLVNERDGLPVENPVVRCLHSGHVEKLPSDSVLLRSDGVRVAIEDSAAPMRDDAGAIVGAVMAFQDVGNARELAQKLSFQACHDSLTGLFNRHEFEKRLQSAISDVQDKAVEHALCYLDLDQFKIVNDTCGHGAGDDLLRALSDILQAKIRDGDMLARLGGDEFGVLLLNCNLEDAERIANTLRMTVSEFRFVWQDKIFEIGVSIGLVGVNQYSKDLTDVLSAADVACYSAKDAGRNRIHVYQQGDLELQKRRGEMQWVNRLQKAVDDNAFCLHYQTIEPLQTSAPSGAHIEVLLRMVGSEGVFILPGAFLPSAERYDLIRSVDQWVVQHLFERFGRLMREKYDANPECHDTYGINLSGKSIDNLEFRQFLVDSIERFNIPASTLCFEITETSAITNLAGARHFIEELKALGCEFALDDFGSGMSSFSYLKNLDVDYLKIDGSYVRDINDDPVDRALVNSVNQIGHVMGMKTIAEYAEDDACLSILKAIGVDYAQGYCLSTPQPIDQFFTSSVTS